MRRDFFDPPLPKGFVVTPDLIVGEMIDHDGLAFTYRCQDHAFNTGVILYEYFPATLARRNNDNSVAPSRDDNTDRLRKHSMRPMISLSSAVTVRGIPGGDTSPMGLFEWGLRRFMEEASLLAKLNHPNITRVFRAFRQNGTAYRTHQEVAGGTLEDEVEKRELSQDDLDKLAEPLLDALALLHSHGFIHRFINPGNIIVRANNGAPVLSGFGAAVLPKVHPETTVVFSETWAPFEEYQANPDRPIGPWTDIYGLAGSLYYAILKIAPLAVPQRVADHLSPSLESQVSKGTFRTSFVRAIDHGLSLWASERPQSIDAWRTELFKGSRAARVPRRQIFISYRRADTSEISGRIYDHLSEVFPNNRVFFDIDTIPATVDFRSHISECMDMTAVCVAVVGDRWRRNRALAKLRPWRYTTDHVHIEIALALDAGIPIVPVLVDNASMPSPSQLPKRLERFCYLNAVRLRSDTVPSDLDKLTLLVSEHVK